MMSIVLPPLKEQFLMISGFFSFSFIQGPEVEAGFTSKVIKQVSDM